MDHFANHQYPRPFTAITRENTRQVSRLALTNAAAQAWSLIVVDSPGMLACAVGIAGTVKHDGEDGP
jgi:hypothetical protein